jgi:hypothetical protein
LLSGVDLGADVLEWGLDPGSPPTCSPSASGHLTCVEKDPALAASLARRRGSAQVEVVEGRRHRPAVPGRPLLGRGVVHDAAPRTFAGAPGPLLAEVARVLAPGAWLVGSDSLVSTAVPARALGRHDGARRSDSFGGRLERAGFSDVRVVRVERAFRFQARRAAIA